MAVMVMRTRPLLRYSYIAFLVTYMYRVTKDIRDCLPSCALYRQKFVRLIGTFFPLLPWLYILDTKLIMNLIHVWLRIVSFLLINVSLSKQNLLANVSFSLESSLTYKCTLINAKNKLKFTLKYA